MLNSPLCPGGWGIGVSIVSYFKNKVFLATAQTFHLIFILLPLSVIFNLQGIWPGFLFQRLLSIFWNRNLTKPPQIDLQTTQDTKGTTEEFR